MAWKASTLHPPKIKGFALNSVGYTRIINMIFHTGADLSMIIFASTSWMIPKSIETIFKRDRKKSARLKTQEGNLGKKEKKKTKPKERKGKKSDSC